MARNAASSSGTKPWVHQTDAVLATALARNGRATIPAAARPRESPITLRLLNLRMIIFPGLRILPRSSRRRRVFRRPKRSARLVVDPLLLWRRLQELQRLYAGHAELSCIDARQVCPALRRKSSLANRVEVP